MFGRRKYQESDLMMEKSFECALVDYCAPVLSGLKPANLFRYIGSDREYVYKEVRRLNDSLHHKGITVRVLKECSRSGCFLVYVYRMSMLDVVLHDPEARSFLVQNGYGADDDAEMLIRRLSDRLCVEKNFPHEIGVFLGYPLIDVVGFIENQGKNYTCSGCWKAYGDSENAKKKFAVLYACTSSCRERFAKGTSVVQLTAAA